MSNRPHRKEVPLDLPPPEVSEQELSDWRAIQPGYLLELSDGQQVVVASTSPEGLVWVRVKRPEGTVMPLGETVRCPAGEAEAEVPVRLLSAWFAAPCTPPPERIVIEAIFRGFITSTN